MPIAAKIRCLGCGRRVKNNPDAKLSHILRYHPQAPMKRVMALFSPTLFEKMGYRIGEAFKAWVS